jgi:hypothetical protein
MPKRSHSASRLLRWPGNLRRATLTVSTKALVSAGRLTRSSSALMKPSGVVDHQPGVADELQETVGHRGE